MIPVSEVTPENLYSQDDAQFLLGEGFSRKAAREAIREACKTGELRSSKWRGRSWFSGQSFLTWIREWPAATARPTSSLQSPTESLAVPPPGGQDAARRPGDRSPSLGGEVST